MSVSESLHSRSGTASLALVQDYLTQVSNMATVYTRGAVNISSDGSPWQPVVKVQIVTELFDGSGGKVGDGLDLIA